MLSLFCVRPGMGLWVSGTLGFGGRAQRHWYLPGTGTWEHGGPLMKALGLRTSVYSVLGSVLTERIDKEL